MRPGSHPNAVRLRQSEETMQFLKRRLPRVVAIFPLVFLCLAGETPVTEATLHWPQSKQETLRIRLIAMAESDPRSSFFSTHEVFVAAQQLKGEDESRLVKLVYAFLPYQPRLSEFGFDYSLIYELHATRDPSCDQSLAQMTTDQRDRSHLALKYSSDSPALNTSRRYHPLPCYSSTPADYTKVVNAPAKHEFQFDNRDAGPVF
jgi:hypothetical protein